MRPCSRSQLFFGCAFAQEILPISSEQGVRGGEPPLYETEEFQEDDTFDRMIIAELEELKRRRIPNALYSFLLVALSPVYSALYTGWGLFNKFLTPRTSFPCLDRRDAAGCPSPPFPGVHVGHGMLHRLGRLCGQCQRFTPAGCLRITRRASLRPSGHGKAGFAVWHQPASLWRFFIRPPVILLDAGLAYVLYRAARDLGPAGAAALLLIAAFNPARF